MTHQDSSESAPFGADDPSTPMAHQAYIGADDPGTPMTCRDSSEEDEFRQADIFTPGAAPASLEFHPDIYAPRRASPLLPRVPAMPNVPIVSPTAVTTPERPIAPFVRTLYALLEGPYDETLCEWRDDGRRIVFPDPTCFAETVCPRCFRHSKWTSFSRMLNMYDFRKVSVAPRDGTVRKKLAPMAFEHESFRRGREGLLHQVQRRKRKKPAEAQRDADRNAEVASLRSRIADLEHRVAQLEFENAQLRGRDHSLQLA